MSCAPRGPKAADALHGLSAPLRVLNVPEGTTPVRTVPIVTGISLSDPGADHTFSANEIIEVRVHFSEQVKFTGTGLVPTLEIDVGGQMRTLNSSTQGNTLVDALRFIYFLSAQRGDADADGITVVAATLGLPSGTRLVNAAGHAARRGFAQWSFPNHRVDTAGPQVTGAKVSLDGRDPVAPPVPVRPGNEMVVTFTTDEELDLDSSSASLPGQTVVLAAVAGEENSYTATIDSLADPIPDWTLNLNLVDRFGNRRTHTEEIISEIDSTPPSLTGVEFLDPGPCVTGQNIDVRITFDEVMRVTETPRLPIVLDTDTVQAVYVADVSGGTEVVFRYQVEAAEVRGPIDLNGGALTDFVGNAAPLDLPASMQLAASVDRLVNYAAGDIDLTDVENAPVPEGLAGEGDRRFRLLFVTTEAQSAESADINHYNRIVQGVADGLQSIRQYASGFRVLGSTEAVAARVNTFTHPNQDVPIYWHLPNNAVVEVADDYADLYDGDWDSNDAGDHLGAQTADIVFTGSNSDGTAHADPLGGGPTGDVRTGTAASGSELSQLSRDSSETRGLYALSPVFVVRDATAVTGSGTSGTPPRSPAAARAGRPRTPWSQPMTRGRLTSTRGR